MSLSDRFYRPFERLIRPLDIPYRPMPSSGPIAVLLHFARMFRGVLVAIALASILIELINLAIIWGISFVVDGIGKQGATLFLADNWETLTVLGILIFPLQPFFIFVVNALSGEAVGVSMPAAMQWQGHKAVERQDLAFFHDLFSGQVASRISQVASAVTQQVAMSASALPNFFVQLVGALILIGTLSWWALLLPIIVWAAANIVVAVIAVPLFAQRARGTARGRSMIVGALTDVYSNIQMVKQFAAEDSEAGMIRGTMKQAIESQHQERRLRITANMCVTLLNIAMQLSVLAIGFWGLADGFVTAGEFVALFAIVQRLASNAYMFMQIGQQLFEAIGTLSDAMPVMTTPPTIVDKPDARPLTVTRGEIRFENIRFGYREGQPVVDGLTLAIAAGEKVGLVGLSGAGKTTLVNLLLRFFDLDRGVIRIDGQDISSVTQASLRASIGVISQDVSLLHRSVGDNIRYGRPSATPAELRRATEMAQADTFIAKLSDKEGRTGFDAYVGDRGVKLSGGQRQRVAIARVLLKDAPILVLDEATSALDSEAEAAIQDKLNLLMNGKTVIAIAHRLSTIAEMDRIVVLDKGRIIEEGSPAELLQRNGLYARLWKRQTGGYIADKEEAL